MGLIRWSGNIVMLLMVSLTQLVCITQAHSLEVRVMDTKGNMLKDAIVVVVSKDGKRLEKSSDEQYLVDQRDKEFIPYMTALPVGGSVVFPNNDNIRHQVYSFSEAKKFEIPLYKGAPEQPIDFDKTGVVALGCNIHDWMKAYIFVTNSPVYGVTNDAGIATLPNAPKGELAIQVWHPTLKGDSAETQQSVSYDSVNILSFTIPTKKVWRAFRSPNNAGSGGYK